MNFELSDNPIKVNISLAGTNAEIISEERNDIELIFPELRNAAINEAFRIDFKDNKLSIKEKSAFTIQIGSFQLNNKKKKFKLIVPHNKSITYTLDQKGGNISTFDKLNGELNLKLMGGNLKMEHFTGSINSSVYGGNIEILEGCLENLTAKILGGNAEICSEIALKKDASVKLLGGNFSLAATSCNTEKKINLKKLGGSFNLTGSCPDDLLVQKHKHGHNGIDFEFDENFENIGKILQNAFKGIKNTFSEFKDDIKVEKPKATPAKDDQIDKILKMLSDGKIDADQAEKLINAITKD